MKMFSKIAIASLVVLTQFASAQAPAGAPAGSTALCNDGTYFNGAKKQGACRGHKGIKDWYGSPTTATTKAASSAPAKAPSAPPTPSTAATPGPKPSDATGLCNDGSYTTGATKQGACRGHKGIKDWYGSASAQAPKAATSTPVAAAPISSPSPSASLAPASRPAAKETAPATAPAPGGGKGQVWLNTTSNVYHCEGSRFYGKTKAGAYMSEADAKAKGARPDRGKPCQ